MRVQRGETSADGAPPRESRVAGGAGLQTMVDLAIEAAAFAAKRETDADLACEELQQSSEAAVMAIGRVAAEVKNRGAESQHLPDDENIRLAKEQALAALAAVEKAASDAQNANTESEDASRDAQMAWSAAAAANAAQTELEMAEVRKKTDATRTMEEASRKAEEDAAFRPSDEASAKAFLAKAAFTKKAAAAAVAETAVKSREKATGTMEEAAKAAGAESAAQGAARKANELVVTLWGSAARLNAGAAVAEAAVLARDNSMRANEVAAQADREASAARQASIEAATKLSAARSKAAKMSSLRVMAETAAAKAAACPRSTIGVEATEIKAAAAVEALAKLEEAAKELEGAAAVKAKAAAESRKLAVAAKAVSTEAASVCQIELTKRQELETQAASLTQVLHDRTGVADEKNTTLEEAELKASQALKTAKGAAKSGKAWAERTEFASRKAEAVAEKARNAAQVANDAVAEQQAAVDTITAKIAVLEEEHAALEAKAKEALTNADSLDAEAKSVEAEADAATTEARAARQKAKDALEHKDLMIRKVKEEIQAKIEDKEESVALAAAIEEAKMQEQAAKEEFVLVEQEASEASDEHHEKANAKKQADIDAKEQAELATKAAADEKGEGRMKLEAVKSAHLAAQKAAKVVASAAEVAILEAQASAAAVETHQAAEEAATKAADSDAALAHGQNANRSSATEARWCRLSGEGLRKALIGEPTEFTIEAFDETGSQQPDGGDTFLVCIRCTRQGTRVPAKIFDNGDGTYTVRYRPMTWGTCSVGVSLLNTGSIRGVPLPGSPFNCHTTSVIPSAPHCMVEAPAIETVACVPNHFHVSFRDDSGALAHAPKSALEVYLQREDEYLTSGLPLAWRPVSPRSPRSARMNSPTRAAADEESTFSGKKQPAEEGKPMEAFEEMVPEDDANRMDLFRPLNTKHVSPRKELDRWARRIAINPARESERARERDQIDEWNRQDGRSTLAKMPFKMPSLYLQDLDMDPERIGFAYGGIQGGDRHQQLQEKYKVDFSVAVVGRYVLHARLRSEVASNQTSDMIIPGSPLKLAVVSGQPAPLSTRIPATQLPLRGYLPPVIKSEEKRQPSPDVKSDKKGRDRTSMWNPRAEVPVAPPPAAEPEEKPKQMMTCSLTLQLCDKAGNQCTSGGGDVTAGVLEPWLDIETSCEDQKDGTYLLKWWSFSPHSKVRVFVRIDGIHILGSPTRLDLIEEPLKPEEAAIKASPEKASLQQEAFGRRAKSAPHLTVAERDLAAPSSRGNSQRSYRKLKNGLPPYRSGRISVPESPESTSREWASYRASQRSSRRAWHRDKPGKKWMAGSDSTKPGSSEKAVPGVKGAKRPTACKASAPAAAPAMAPPLDTVTEEQEEEEPPPGAALGQAEAPKQIDAPKQVDLAKQVVLQEEDGPAPVREAAIVAPPASQAEPQPSEPPRVLERQLSRGVPRRRSQSRDSIARSDSVLEASAASAMTAQRPEAAGDGPVQIV